MVPSSSLVEADLRFTLLSTFAGLPRELTQTVCQAAAVHFCSATSKSFCSGPNVRIPCNIIDFLFFFFFFSFLSFWGVGGGGCNGLN